MTLGTVRILGVDPGSRFTGFGCVESHAGKLRLLEHGTLRLNEKTETARDLADRLLRLSEGLDEVILRSKPQILVVEKVFFAKNAMSALKLGQARGVVLLAGAAHSLEVREYNASEVKKAITGYGQADKDQVAKMLQALLGKQAFDTPDASDGLALAVYHALMGGSVAPKKSRSLADAVRHRAKI